MVTIFDFKIQLDHYSKNKSIELKLIISKDEIIDIHLSVKRFRSTEQTFEFHANSYLENASISSASFFSEKNFNISSNTFQSGTISTEAKSILFAKKIKENDITIPSIQILNDSNKWLNKLRSLIVKYSKEKIDLEVLIESLIDFIEEELFDPHYMRSEKSFYMIKNAIYLITKK